MIGPPVVGKFLAWMRVSKLPTGIALVLLLLCVWSGVAGGVVPPQPPQLPGGNGDVLSGPDRQPPLQSEVTCGVSRALSAHHHDVVPTDDTIRPSDARERPPSSPLANTEPHHEQGPHQEPTDESESMTPSTANGVEEASCLIRGQFTTTCPAPQPLFSFFSAALEGIETSTNVTSIALGSVRSERRFPTYEEWKALNTQTVSARPNTHLSYRQRKRRGVVKDRINHVAQECGGKIIMSNPEAGSVSNVQLEQSDRYMLNLCAASPKFFVIELCDEILIDTIALANFELFSSTFKDVRVMASAVYPPREWTTLGVFRANNTRSLQIFSIKDPVLWARYVRVDLLTHYGREYYCPVSTVQVFGTTMMEDYRDEMEEMLIESVRNNVAADGVEDDDENENVGGHGDGNDADEVDHASTGSNPETTEQAVEGDETVRQKPGLLQTLATNIWQAVSHHYPDESPPAHTTGKKHRVSLRHDRSFHDSDSSSDSSQRPPGGSPSTPHHREKHRFDTIDLESSWPSASSPSSSTPSSSSPPPSPPPPSSSSSSSSAFQEHVLRLTKLVNRPPAAFPQSTEAQDDRTGDFSSSVTAEDTVDPNDDGQDAPEATSEAETSSRDRRLTSHTTGSHESLLAFLLRRVSILEANVTDSAQYLQLQTELVANALNDLDREFAARLETRLQNVSESLAIALNSRLVDHMRERVASERNHHETLEQLRNELFLLRMIIICLVGSTGVVLLTRTLLACSRPLPVTVTDERIKAVDARTRSSGLGRTWNKISTWTGLTKKVGGTMMHVATDQTTLGHLHQSPLSAPILSRTHHHMRKKKHRQRHQPFNASTLLTSATSVANDRPDSVPNDPPTSATGGELDGLGGTWAAGL